MSDLTFREKRLIADVLEFDGGYVFTILSKYEHFNKTTARDIIFGASGIDIFTNPKYSTLSQQKCLEQIWDIESNYTAGSVLKDFLLFYDEHYPPMLLEDFHPLRTEEDAQATISYLPIYADRVEKSTTMTIGIRVRRTKPP